MNKHILILLISFHCLRATFSPPPGATTNHSLRVKICDDNYFSKQISIEKLNCFLKTFKNNLFSDEDINIIHHYCVMYNINPILVCAKMEHENNLVKNINTNNYEKRYFRACCYGLSYRSTSNTNWIKYVTGTGKVWYYKYGGYENQISNCCRILNKYYRQWMPNKTRFISGTLNTIGTNYEQGRKSDNGTYMFFDNASSYSLFVYTPHFGEFKYSNWPEGKYAGNEVFKKILDQFRKIEESIK